MSTLRSFYLDAMNTHCRLSLMGVLNATHCSRCLEIISLFGYI